MKTIYRNLLDTLPGNIYWLDKEGVLIGCNANQLSALGFKSPDEFEGKKLIDVVPLDQAEMLLKTLHDVINRKETITIEERLTINGEEKCFISKKSPLLDNEGNTEGVVGYSVEIPCSNRFTQQDENKMIRAVQSSFFDSLFHDFRTPFFAINLTLESLIMDEKDSEKSKALSTIKTCLKKIESHCTSVYDGCKNKKQRPPILTNQPLDLQHIVDELISMHKICADVKKIKLIGEYDANIPMLLGDNERVKIIVLHLLSNAIKFTEEGCVAVKVTVFPKEKSSEVIAKITVKDTGQGISESLKSTLFQDFSTETPVCLAQHQGLGLGLSLVKRAVDEMKGEIKADSKKDCGSTFTVYLPLKVSMEDICY